MASTRTQVSFFALERDAESFLSERLPSARLSSYSGGLSPAMLRRHADATVLAPFINSPVNAKVLDALPKLRLVSCMSTGFDHVDLEECRKRGIAVCNVPSYGENTVAEHTFALILNLSRKVHLAFERTVRGNFSTAGLMGFDLKGKTIGIIGAGKIGYHVARIARGFEMDILVSNPTVRPEWKKEFGARFVGLDELLKRSDVVTIHCPLNDATRHLINQKNIRLMKRDAVLINTARGPIVDTVALALALDRKWIAGAGLDVLENENLIKEETQVLFRHLNTQQRDSLLLEYRMLYRENVIITPHNAFNSREALQRILDETAQNIRAWQNGKKRNRVV